MVGRGVRLRICHIISADLWAGAAVQVYETITDLRARGVEVSVAVFNDGIFARRIKDHGVPLRILDETRLGTIAVARGLARFLGEQAPQALHVHAYKEHIVASLASRMAGQRLPIVRTFHGMRQVPSNLPAVQRVRSQAVGWLERRLLRRAVLVAVSEDLDGYLRHAYPSTRVEFVPNGVRLPLTAGDRARARARWTVPEGAFWAGCVARLEAVKNLPCLIRAAASLCETLPELRVSIFGVGSEQDSLAAFVSSKGLDGVVRLHGFDDDIPGTICGFDCFVLSSLHEGLPMSLLEAMAARVPSVCSRVGGMGELIESGKTGLLFESNDHEELAACLMKMYQSREDARRMGLAAQQLIRESYAIGVTNQALLRLYESIVPARSAEPAGMNGARRP